MKAIGVIPARLESSRLARKLLREIAGRPMLAWVYEAAHSCPLLGDVVIATDSEEILSLCRQNSWNALRTDSRHQSGTERIREVAARISSDIYLNIQGDEPLTRREHLDTLLEGMQDPSVLVATLKTPASGEEASDPNAVKVVTTSSGWALYFSRSRIPYERPPLRPEGTRARCYKHLGLYGYRKPALERFVALRESELEGTEKLEQLRFLEHGIGIRVLETPFSTIGVDTEADLRRAETLLLERAPA